MRVVSTSRSIRALATVLSAALAATGVAALTAAPSAQAASATPTVWCQPYNTGLLAPATESVPLSITVSPSSTFNSHPVTVTVSADASFVNHGPSTLEAGRYRFEAAVSVGTTTKRLAGPVSTTDAAPEGGAIFAASQFPLVAKGTFTAPSEGTWSVFIQSLYANDIDSETGGEGVTDTFDIRCNASSQPNANPTALAAPRASLVSRPAVQPDVRAIKVDDITVRSGNCKTTVVRTTWAGRGAPYAVSSAWAFLRKGTNLVDAVPVNAARSSALWCPYLDGVGRFTVGNTQVVAYDPVTFAQIEYVDSTTGSFHARYATRAKITSASRSGSRVTLGLKATRYKLSAGYVKHSPKATVQYKAGTKWKKVTTVRLRGGKATVSFPAKKKRTYRIVLAESRTMAKATSRTVRR